MRPKNELTNYLINRVPKNGGWRGFTQFMYEKITTLANKLKEVIMMMKAQNA
jgi:hypothetical protein